MSAFVSDLFSVRERVALVSGASSGIGRHMAEVLAKTGASVVLVARREAALEEVRQRIVNAGGKAALIAWDVGER